MTALYREEWTALHSPTLSGLARDLTLRAEGLARSVTAEHVRVDHLVAAAAIYDTNDATSLFERLRVDGQRVQACALGDAPAREVDRSAHIPWSQSAKQALEHAMDLARSHRAIEITTAHVLAGALFMASDDLRRRLGGTGLSYHGVLSAIVVAPAPRATCASCRHWEPLPEADSWGKYGRCRRAPFPASERLHLGGETGVVTPAVFVVTHHGDWCAAVEGRP